MAGLRLEHIYKVYPNGTKAVSNFTMDIEDKEFIVFVGPSGCGKSTTLRMIAGLEDISAGELYIGDRIVNDVEPKDRDIAMVFQNYALYPHMTVYENMAFGLKLRHVPNAEIHEKVLWAAKVLDLTEYLDRKPKAMSGGQRQRVSLGRAILRNPKVMLLDEPLSNLDAKLRAQMRSEIAKLHENLQTTFIYVTHDQVEAMTLGTRVVVMRLGEIMQIDTPKNLYDYPNNLFVAGFIGTPQMNFFQATLTKVNSNIHINFKWSENAIDVPQALLAKVQPQYFDGKKEVIVGVRCEDLSLDPEVVSKSKYLIDVKISHFEELGNETLIYADMNLEGDGFSETSTRTIIKGRSTYGLQKGQVVKAAIDVKKVHMFDKKTEKTINPRVPNDNLITCEIKDGKLFLGELSYKLPKVINLANGTYDVLIPTSAITLKEDGSHKTNVESVEKINDITLVGVRIADQILFTTLRKDEEVSKQVSIELDFTQIEFKKDNKVVQESISEFDSINGMFLNHSTAKQYVGDAYDEVVKERIQKVRDTYEPKINALKQKYEEDCAKASTIDSAYVNAENKVEIQKRKAALNEKLLGLKTEFKENRNNMVTEHKANNEKITKEVNEMYDKIWDDEISSFESFKALNKDRDVYRKRAAEIREFKENFKLERANELSKRINLEAVRFESALNTLKGTYKRTTETLKKEHQDFIAECNRKAFPLKGLTKNYRQELAAIEKEYSHQLDLAEIIFFFKTGNFVTLSTDDISNKMVQSLGVKVFTKQYLLEIPHDAYYEAEGGLELEVKELLDYSNKKFLHCIYHDGTEDRNLYIETKRDEHPSKLVMKFDVSKIHITEKSMEIKIY